MSKAVVVLVTAGPEYRVRLFDNPEQLYLGINANTGKWIPNSEFIHKEYIGYSSFTDEATALMIARSEAQDVDLEGGIQVIDIWSDTSYTDL